MMTLIQQGGSVMWLILAAGFIALMVFLERMFHVHRAKIKSDDFVRGICNILGHRNIREALGICDETPGPVAQIVRTAIQHRDQNLRLMEQAIDDTAVMEIARLERRFGALVMIAQLAPLMGLFGTVMGLIHTAIMIEQKAPLIQAGDLSGGIWLALIPTAAGLGVAIFSYFGYNLLVIKVEGLVLDMERSVSEIVGFFIRTPAVQPESSVH